MEYKKYHIDKVIEITDMVSIFKQTYNADSVFPGEYHDFWECVYVVSGSICAAGDERVYYLNSGDIIFHKPMEFHRFNINNSDGAVLFIFSFSMEGELCASFEDRVFSLTERQRGILGLLMDYVSDYGEADGAENFRKTDYMPGFWRCATYPQTVSVYLQRLFLMLCEDGSAAPAATTSDSLIFRSIVLFMQEHIRENFSVDELAACFCLSKSALKRIFGKFTGIGIHKYFIQMKINEASRLLDGGMNVTETAEYLGFSEQAYFSKVYKKSTGASPSHRNKIFGKKIGKSVDNIK